MPGADGGALRGRQDGAVIGTISVEEGQYDAPEELVQTANASTKLSVVITDVSP